jgi:hypothetical protein
VHEIRFPDIAAGEQAQRVEKKPVAADAERGDAGAALVPVTVISASAL